MIAPSRRHLLAGAAAMLAPRVGWAAATDAARASDAAVRAALDEAARLAPTAPAAALDRLAGVRGEGASLGRRLDLDAARAGLRIDATLAAAFPIGRAGRSPYRITPTSGAWLKDDPDAIGRETAGLARDRAAGVVLPRALLATTRAAVAKRSAAAPAPAASALADLLAELDRAAPRAPARLGVGQLPQGLRFYDLLLQRQGGSDLTAAASRVRLERERRRLSAEADRLFDRIGVAAGDTGARFKTLWRDERFLYPDSDAGRDRAVADMNRMLDRIRPQVTRWVGPVPPMCLDVRAVRLSRAEEAAGKSGYRVLPEPGKPGAYLPDLQRIRARPSWTLPSVVAHELLPGHMVQLPIEAADPPHPLRIDYAPVFAEGWAIHAETVVAGAGLFDTPHAMLGHLHWMLFRVCRGLADLGIHLDGWSIDEARGRLEAWMGEPGYFAPFDSDLQRMAIEPATRAAEAMAWVAVADRVARSAPAGRAAARRMVLAGGRKRTEMLKSHSG